ncbi:MAG: cobalamin-dependent protein [Thermodesulforhabdaceae bacterium]
MNRAYFLEAVREKLEIWEKSGIPPRWSLLEELKKLQSLRISLGLSSICENPPRLITATLDDGWGLGIEVIHMACNALGIPYNFLGLMKTPEEIVDACASDPPDIVGVTVIQEDSAEELLRLRRLLQPNILILAGGPGLKDPAEISHENNLIIVKNVSHFIRMIIDVTI